MGETGKGRERESKGEVEEREEEERERGESISWPLHRNQWVLLAEGVLKTLLKSLPGCISKSSTPIIIMLERCPGGKRNEVPPYFVKSSQRSIFL